MFGAGSVTSSAGAPGAAPGGRRFWPVILVVALALVLRLVFWQATPDSSWPHSALYKGDAPTWIEQAHAISSAQPFEFDLPLRPPGAAYLMAALPGGGGSVIPLKLLWILLGAAVVAMVYWASARDFGPSAGLVCGIICAGSTGLMILTTSLNNETPYLVLVAGCLLCWKPMLVRQNPTLIVLWAILNAAACLVRVEHLLFCLAASAVVAARWFRDSSRARALGRCVLGVVVFTAVLAPWHVHAWQAINRFNTIEHHLAPNADLAMRQVEEALAGIEWTEEAESRRAQLPAFCRRENSAFIAATVAVRGKNRVTAADLAILQEAFGSIPEPLPGRPFVTFYGGLNFHLANNSGAAVGFNRAPLELPPPLVGGAESYPAFLVRGLPPPNLAFAYPPHLEAVNRGWSMGSAWLAGHPREALGRWSRRLVPFWSGSAMGFGGANVPLGLSGVRGRADMVAPTSSAPAAVWRVCWLAVAGIGLFFGLRASPLELAPWLVFLATKIIAATVFFGYARHGASAVPVIALLAGLATVNLLPSDRWSTARRVAPLTVAALFIVLEVTRWILGPQVSIDGREIAGGDPWPIAQHTDRTVTVTW